MSSLRGLKVEVGGGNRDGWSPQRDETRQSSVEDKNYNTLVYSLNCQHRTDSHNNERVHGKHRWK